MKFSVAAIILHKGKYLFQKRDNKSNIFYPNFYGLFGGASNKYEKPKQVLKRELYEELNIKFKDIEHLINLKLDSRNFNPKTASIFNRHFFICKLPNNFKRNINLKEGQNYKFMNINRINKNELSPFDYAVTKYYDLLKK